MVDTFENSFSELLEEEGEEKTLVASLTLWPTATSGPFKSRTFVFDKGPIVLGRALEIRLEIEVFGNCKVPDCPIKLNIIILQKEGCQCTKT